MDDYISRKAAIDAVENVPKGNWSNSRYVKELQSVEKADVRPVVHGKWIDVDAETYTWKIRCAECDHERSMLSTQGKYPHYCENCSAQMDGGENDE